MNITTAITKDYENEQPGRPGQNEPNLAVRLVELTRCQKEESARKACQQVLAIANRFFEAVARINEGPLKEYRGDFGGFSRKIGTFSD